MLKITAAIPAYNEANRVVRTLNQVKPFVDEIIVVDDVSQDVTADLVKKNGATVFTLKNMESKPDLENTLGQPKAPPLMPRYAAFGL